MSFSFCFHPPCGGFWLISDSKVKAVFYFYQKLISTYPLIMAVSFASKGFASFHHTLWICAFKKWVTWVTLIG
jgi:hypothetical protein